jgi:hypothetical protein
MPKLLGRSIVHHNNIRIFVLPMPKVMSFYVSIKKCRTKLKILPILFFLHNGYHFFLTEKLFFIFTFTKLFKI